MTKIKQLLESEASLAKRLKELHDVEERALTTEENAEFDAKLAELKEVRNKIKSERDYLKEAEERGAEKHTPEADKSAEQIFERGLRSGFDRLTVEEKRAIATTASNAATIPSTLADKIEVALHAECKIPSLANAMPTTNGNPITIPCLKDTAKAINVDEGVKKDDEISLSSLFDSKELGAHTYRTNVYPVSNELLQDSAFDLVSVLSKVFADQFARTLEAESINGIGGKQISGIMKDAEELPLTSKTSLSYDNFVDVTVKVGSAYAPKGVYVMHPKTWADCKKIKDNNGRPLLQENVTADMPQMILGHKVILSEEMPLIEAGASPVLFGDFNKFIMRKVKGMTIKRLEETYALNNAVGFIAFARYDGLLLDAGTHPFAKITMGAA